MPRAGRVEAILSASWLRGRITIRPFLEAFHLA
jgi:hypothetical protein